MRDQSLLSIIESSTHPNFSSLYARMGLRHVQVNSIRKALNKVKAEPPDLLVAEFFYGYGNNYAGVNISNLDVLLSSLQKYSPLTQVIVLVDRSEQQHVAKLNALFPLHAVLTQPVQEQRMASVLAPLTSGRPMDDPGSDIPL